MGTVVNVTNHSYFNLSGDFSKAVNSHIMLINADAFTPVQDKNAIPTGEVRPVESTPFDFLSPKSIGKDIDDTSDKQIEFGIGYDHNLVLKQMPEGTSANTMRFCATVFEPTSKRKMDVFTTEPAVQFYTGNFMDAARGSGKKGVALGHRTGFCLETQHFPDSPNQPTFPSTALAPGARYSSRTIYRFGLGQQLKSPKWKKVSAVKPEMKGINMFLKCVSCTKLPVEGNKPQEWEAVVGDDSGVVTLLLRTEKHASLCNAGSGLRLQNGKAVMVNGFIRVVVDKWSVLKASTKSDEEFEVNTKTDVSAVEYEKS